MGAKRVRECAEKILAQGCGTSGKPAPGGGRADGRTSRTTRGPYSYLMVSLGRRATLLAYSLALKYLVLLPIVVWVSRQP